MYDEISSKIHWLRKNLPPSILTAFNKKITSELAALVDQGSIYPGVIPSVSIDINYCLFKNSRWTHLKLFQQLMRDFISTDYGLEPELCDNLISQLIHTKDRLVEFNKQEHSSIHEKDFFHYLYVCSSTSNPATNLVHKFGLGSQILTKIKSAISIVSSCHKSDQNSYNSGFIPEFEAIFIEVIQDLARQLEVEPLAIDLCKLRYSLSNLNNDDKDLVEKVSFKEVFKIILSIGSERSHHTNQLQKEFSTLDSNEIQKVLAILRNRDLIYVEGLSKANGNKWKLTDDSFDITALAFAQDFLSSDQNFSNLSKFHHLYQHAVINLINSNGIDTLIDFTKQGHADPQTVEAIVNKVHSYSGPAMAVDLASYLINNSKNSWTRRAACKALSTWSEQNHIRQILEKVAESDSVCQVRETALGYIINREAT